MDRASATCERNERRVADLSDRVEDALAAVSHAEAAAEQQRRTVGRAEGRLRELADAAATLREAVECESGRAVQTRRNRSDIPELLTSPTTQEALSRTQMLSVVEHSDREALEQVLASQTALDAQRDLLEQQQRIYEDALGDANRSSASSSSCG